MKALILGASGYLGSVLFAKMRQRPDVESIGTCCHNSKNERLLAVDVTDKQKLQQVWESHRPDVVIWVLMSKTDERKLIHQGLRNLLEIIHPDTKMIYVSTDGIFLGDRGNYSEEDPTQYIDPNRELATYCNAKLDGEKMIQLRHHNHVVVRTGPIYGQDEEGNWDKRVSTLTARLTAGEQVVRSGNVYRTFTHVEDLAEALMELSLLDVNGILHVGPEQKESYYTFTRKMAHKLNLPIELVGEDYVSPEEAKQKGILLNCSLATEKARKMLQTTFRSLLS